MPVPSRIRSYSHDVIILMSLSTRHALLLKRLGPQERSECVLLFVTIIGVSWGSKVEVVVSQCLPLFFYF